MRPTITVDYTSRDYASIRADLVKLVTQQLREIHPSLQWDPQDPSDFGVVLLESFAYMGDIMSYYIDRAANETSIDNAVQKSTIFNLAQLYGYRPSGPTPATVALTFINAAENTESVSLPIGTQAIVANSSGEYSEIYFETTEAIADLAPGASVTVNAFEGRTCNTDVTSGISSTTYLPIPVLLVDLDGSSESNGLANQERIISDFGVVDGSVKVYVGQGSSFRPWRFVDNLVEYGPRDQVFTTKLNADNTTTVIFGDGVNGAIPDNGQTLSALYKISYGYAGNVSANTINHITYVPGQASVSPYVAVKNLEASYGGANADDITQIKSKLKKAISSRKRAVTLKDYEYVASLVPRVGKVKAYAIHPSSVTLYLQPQKDNTTSPGWDETLLLPTAAWDTLSEDVLAYMEDKIPVGTTLTILPPVYEDIDLTLTIVADSNYKNSDVTTAVTNALLSSTGLFSYDSYGFGETVALSDIFYKIMGVPGVKSLNVNVLDLHGGSASADVLIDPDQIPRLLSDNLTLYVSGGIG